MSTWGACKVFLYNWQSLIAGLLGLLAGIVAFVGALMAARSQVRAMRRTTDNQVKAVQQAANDQVAAVQKQLADTQAAREESDRRRRSVVEWAVRVELRRLEAEIRARNGKALPSAPDYANRRIEQLVIASSPLLRGEREDMALLDDVTVKRLKAVAVALGDYNSLIETAVDTAVGKPLIVQETHDAFDRLAAQVQDLGVAVR